MTQTLLRLDASARRAGSVLRKLADTVVHRLDPVTVIHRDLAAAPVPQIDEGWIGASFTPSEDRTDDQRATLRLSDTLVTELRAADTLVIALPIYNFGVPAALKAWIDQIARAGVTFRYTAEGPVGLLEGKRAIVVLATGGTRAGSEIDFATGYLRHILSFVGIADVEFVTADRLMADADSAVRNAEAQIDRLAA